VLAGMAIFGAGWGVSQNATLALMLEKVSSSGYGTASALWYVAYDAGLGLGAAGFGAVAVLTGYPAAFALTAALVLATVLPARHDLELALVTIVMPDPRRSSSPGDPLRSYATGHQHDSSGPR
jgi:predicted MFS family arabinose efflux permease